MLQKILTILTGARKNKKGTVCTVPLSVPLNEKGQAVNASGFAGHGPYCSNRSISLRQRRPGSRLSNLPSFTSLLVKPNAVENRPYAKYKESNPKWQGQIFKEVTGKAYTDDVFSKVAVDAGGEFIDQIFAPFGAHKEPPPLQNVYIDYNTNTKLLNYQYKRDKEKGQGDIHPALRNGSSTDKRSSAEGSKNIALENIFVKSGKHE